MSTLFPPHHRPRGDEGGPGTVHYSFMRNKAHKQFELYTMNILYEFTAIMFIMICNQDQFRLCHFKPINAMAMVIILLAMLMLK